MRRLDSTCDLLSSLATARSFCAATTLALIGSLSAASFAATRFWDGGGGTDTDRTTGANWALFNPGPTADYAVQFDRGAAFNYTVTFPRLSFRGDVHTQSLWIGANIVTFEPAHLSIGFNFATRLLVGFEANKPAVLNMNLSNMSAEYVTIGGYIEDYANGTLNIANNDQLTVTGSTDSNLEFILGYSDGIGTLNLSSGGKVILTGAKGDILLGTYNGAGKVTITGAGSTLSTAAGLWVGENGTGTIDVTAGGQLKSGTTYMGDYTNENGKVTVDGIGSTWTNAAAIYLGDDGHGVLEITSGGSAVFGESYLGKKNSSSGIVL